MIRQAISCDICSAEKKQTNHWFVAYEQAGELRVSGWGSRNRLRAGAKHLCGQTCLHKLVDEFMARTIAGRSAATTAEGEEPVVATDTSLTSTTAYDTSAASYRTSTAAYDTSTAPYHTSSAAYDASTAPYDEFESSARLITTDAPAAMQRPVPVEVVRIQPDVRKAIKPVSESATYAARPSLSEAWERERERELRAAGRQRKAV